MKKYLLDTNVLLHSPEALFAFEENHIYIPLVVIEELDTFKVGNNEVNANARKVIRDLDKICEQGNISEGLRIPENDGTLTILVDEAINSSSMSNDDKILAYAKKFNAILVTKDMNLRVKANANGVEAQKYLHDKVENGKNLIQEIIVSDSDLEKAFTEEDLVTCDCNTEKLFKNNYILLRTKGKKSGVLAQYVNGNVFKKIQNVNSVYNIVPKNYEQRFAIDALLSDELSVVVINGVAGSGKTLLSLTCGIHKTIEGKMYKKIIITKPTISMGSKSNNLGFLPGDLKNKMEHWVKPFYDNLEFLELDPEYLLETKTVEIEALAYMRGRTFNNSYIIIDETQNLTPLEVKTILSRVGKNSKIVFLGDTSQIDNQYLDKYDNGLSYLMHKLKGDDIVACIQMTKSERSKVAKLAIEKL